MLHVYKQTGILRENYKYAAAAKDRAISHKEMNSMFKKERIS